MKTFEQPMVELSRFDLVDNITTSAETTVTEEPTTPTISLPEDPDF
ncbi:MAG: hypothetical protein IJG45_03645 [Oscillospiraceae bacterium]|nr:hypothetical protein [Oscillospiraceae bacterium]